MPFLYKNKIHRFSCIDFLWHYFVCSALNVLSTYCTIVKDQVWNINFQLKVNWAAWKVIWHSGKGGGCCLTKYILQHFCNNETSFTYRIDFYCTYWFDDFSPAKETIKNMYKTGIYIMYTYVHTLLSHDKCFEIPICTDNLNKQ